MADEEIDRLRSALAHAYEEKSPFPRRLLRKVMSRFGDRMEKQAIERIIPSVRPNKKKDAA